MLSELIMAMNTEYTKTVLVTGAAKGIGRACVDIFVSNGWNVLAVDSDAAALEFLGVGEESLLAVCASTTDRAAMASAVQDACHRFGGLDCVVANAGIHRSNTILTVSDSELHKVIDTNIYGTIYTLQAAIPTMRRGGSIVIMASDQSTVGKAHSFAYGLTKGALGQMAKSLAIDLAPMGIRVNAVCPSTIATPLVDGVFSRCVDAGANLQELWTEENALFLRGSVGQPSEVAAMVYFLASAEAAFCTGGLYPVDGGYTAR